MAQNVMDIEMSRVSIKWDISTERAKLMLRDLGVGFLPVDSQNSLNQNPMQMLSTCLTPTMSAVSLSTKKLRTGNEIASDFEEGDLHIEILSDEIMLRIFAFLPKSVIVGKCALVCKRWHRVAFDPSLWRKVDLSRKQLSADQLRCVLERQVVYARLASISINEVLTFTKTLNLQYLDLSMANITVDTVNNILNYCEKSLIKLSLESLDINQSTIELLSKQDDLKVLNLSLCRFTENKKEFCSKLPVTLKELDASWINDLLVSSLVRALPVNLLRLNLSGYRKNFSNDDIDYLTVKCSELRELNISDCTQICTKAMQFITVRLKNLEHLHLSRCYSIVFDDYSNCKSLKTISMFGLSTSSIICEKQVDINKHPFSSVARPTVANRRQFMWEVKMN
ncbi:hypothetical protein B4U80_13769 [Leptotrombidium deliense]|uniref:F-box domain-containing protein n=1 Tax=Leptotrombidium deliense TaxID=299467 RepID=A0A443SFK4_9ACAR|nr:hypothetical protein B4U80_13769 [Leptotrombidium deliense]